VITQLRHQTPATCPGRPATTSSGVARARWRERHTNPATGTASSSSGRNAPPCNASADSRRSLQDVTEVEYRQLRLERVVLAAYGPRARPGRGELASRTGRARRDGGIDGAGPGCCSGASETRPGDLARLGQGPGAARRRPRRRCRHRDLRRRTRAVPAARPRRHRQGQGHRPDRPDPRHLRPARQVREGKAQVELAQLQYLLPRLRGWGESMSRQAGGRVAGGEGIGSRGPGETKIELDRRRINSRIAKLRREIAR
jgi:GTP-binding protein HflX